MMLMECYTSISHLHLNHVFSITNTVYVYRRWTTEIILAVTGSSNNSVKKGPQEVFSPASCSKQGKQGQTITQNFIQPGLENLQEWKMHIFSGQPFSMVDYPDSEKGFPYIHSEPPISIVHCISSFLHTTVKSLTQYFW